MAWAEDETDPISTSSMTAEFGDVNPAQETIPDLEAKDAQLYAVLQTLCEKEAFTLVRSSGKGKGLEAWRRLCKRYDPSTGGRRRALLRSVLSPNRCGKVEELSAAVENWEDQVRQYENRRKTDGTRRTLDEDIKISILAWSRFARLRLRDISNSIRRDLPITRRYAKSCRPTWKRGSG